MTVETGALCCEIARRESSRTALLRATLGFVSAERLLEQVWDEHADPFTHTVTVTIGRLWRKLGAPPVIATTPGVGYRSSDLARDTSRGSVTARLRSVACRPQ